MPPPVLVLHYRFGDGERGVCRIAAPHRRPEDRAVSCLVSIPFLDLEPKRFFGETPGQARELSLFLVCDVLDHRGRQHGRASLVGIGPIRRWYHRPRRPKGHTAVSSRTVRAWRIKR